MKKVYFVWMMLVGSMMMSAEEVPSMLVWDLNQQSTIYELSTLRKIVFGSETEFTVFTRTGEEESYVISEVDKITFANVNAPSAIEEVGESRESKVDSRKILRNGQLFIIRDGHMYNVMGAKVR